MLETILFAVIFSGAALGADSARETFVKPTGPSAEATRLLREALTEIAKPDASVDENAKLLTTACQAAITQVAPQSLLGEKLATAVEATKKLPRDQAVGQLKQAASEALDMLQFQPLHEADLPQGFPTYTSAGTMEVKQYPGYRMAVGSGFWPLFSHIKRNNIAMTAPVQMEYENNKQGQLGEKSMAFLYGTQNLGAIGKQGSVKVVDVQAETVVAIGVRGLRTRDRLSDTHRRLLKWIEAHPEYQVAGPLRVMGYNSPFVPSNKQFFEMQIPLQKVNTLEGKEQSEGGVNDR